MWHGVVQFCHVIRLEQVSFMNKKFYTVLKILTLVVVAVVLFVSAVIGVKNYQYSRIQAKTIHFYSMISQALSRYISNEGSTSIVSVPFVENRKLNGDNAYRLAKRGVEDFVVNYFDVVDMCVPSRMNDCFSDKSFSIGGKSFKYFLMDKRANAYVLSNGAVMLIKPATVFAKGGVRNGVLLVDINGKKGPNVAGRDIRYLSIHFDGSVTDVTYYVMASVYHKISKDELKEFTMEMAEQRSKCCFGKFGKSSYKYGGGRFGRFKKSGFKFDY